MSGETDKPLKLGKIDLAFLFIFSISIVCGLLIVDDYGLSWDEYRDISYGKIVRKAYVGDESFRWEETNRHYYGPLEWMLTSLASDVVISILPRVQIYTVWKLMSFLIFQMGVFSFYYLCRRYASRIQALFTSTLLMSQPIFWGHAFINQKDIPFMSFFVLCITLGLKGIDAFNQFVQSYEGSTTSRRVRFNDKLLTYLQKWHVADKRMKLRLMIILLLLLFFTVNLVFAKRFFLPLLQNIVREAYRGESIGIINSLFEKVAQDAYKSPLELYFPKVERLYDFVHLLLILGLFLTLHHVYKRIFDSERKDFQLRKAARELSYVLIPAIVFGLTISIRVVGIYAGILVSGYLLYKSKRRAIIPLIAYWAFAACVTYATWPYLWGAPIPRLLESIQEAGSFSSLETLFQGVIQSSENIPIHYLPYLLMVQLTEPALLLILLGIIILIGKWRRKEVERAYLLLIGAWFAVPMLAEIVLRVPIYDNFRQFLFIVPPLILISGWGAAYLYERLKPNWVAVTILVIMLLPGIVGIVRLHPYEYVYYNAIVGGVNGAYGEYELDYWCTSLKEAMGFLNENAKPNSTVYISGPIDAATPYARDDLKFVHDRSLVPNPDYVVACRNVVLSEEFYPDYEVIHEVGIGRGVFAVIKEKLHKQ